MFVSESLRPYFNVKISTIVWQLVGPIHCDMSMLTSSTIVTEVLGLVYFMSSLCLWIHCDMSMLMSSTIVTEVLGLVYFMSSVCLWIHCDMSMLMSSTIVTEVLGLVYFMSSVCLWRNKLVSGLSLLYSATSCMVHNELLLIQEGLLGLINVVNIHNHILFWNSGQLVMGCGAACMHACICCGACKASLGSGLVCLVAH